MDPRGLTPLQWLDMVGPGAGHGVQVAALLGILATALLITEAGALHCHSYSSVLYHDRDGKPFEISVALPNSTESCSPSHSACVEAFITLSSGGTSVTVIQKGCGNEHTKGGAESPAAPYGFLHVQTHIRYCQSDLCNAKKMGLGSPSQSTAPTPTGSTQCYAGLSLDPQSHSLEQVTCNGADAHCYHGNGTLIAEKLTVPIFIWHCQTPSCEELPTRHFGPVQLSQAGTCCSSSYCNGHDDLDPLSKKWRSRRSSNNNPLKSTTASEAWKGHEHPGLSNNTAAHHPYTDNITNEPDTSLEDNDYNSEPFPGYRQTDHPHHKGDTHPSIRPHPYPTKLNEKNHFTKYTGNSGHDKHGTHKSQAPGLHFCPLLVMLGIAGLGL